MRLTAGLLAGTGWLFGACASRTLSSLDAGLPDAAPSDSSAGPGDGAPGTSDDGGTSAEPPAIPLPPACGRARLTGVPCGAGVACRVQSDELLVPGGFGTLGPLVMQGSAPSLLWSNASEWRVFSRQDRWTSYALEVYTPFFYAGNAEGDRWPAVFYSGAFEVHFGAVSQQRWSPSHSLRGVPLNNSRPVRDACGRTHMLLSGRPGGTEYLVGSSEGVASIALGSYLPQAELALSPRGTVALAYRADDALVLQRVGGSAEVLSRSANSYYGELALQFSDDGAGNETPVVSYLDDEVGASGSTSSLHWRDASGWHAATLYSNASSRDCRAITAADGAECAHDRSSASLVAVLGDALEAQRWLLLRRREVGLARARCGPGLGMGSGPDAGYGCRWFSASNLHTESWLEVGSVDAGAFHSAEVSGARWQLPIERLDRDFADPAQVARARVQLAPGGLLYAAVSVQPPSGDVETHLLAIGR